MSIFLHLKVVNNQEMTKQPCSGTPHRVPIHLITLSLRMTVFGVFPDHFSSDHFYALPIAFRKEKFINIYTKCHLKPVKFLPSK